MKKSKSFTLLSGKEDDCFWSIVCTTNCDGSFRKIGDIHIRNKEYNQKYFQNHKEECLKRKREWRRKNQTKDREYYQQYRKNHREKINEQSREWRAMQKEELRKRYRMYYENNEKRRLQMKKHASSRREYLGYIPLNTPFPGACGHHIDKDHVIFIPKELHRSIYHSVLKKINMEEINRRVFEWIATQVDLKRNTQKKNGDKKNKKNDMYYIRKKKNSITNSK